MKDYDLTRIYPIPPEFVRIFPIRSESAISPAQIVIIDKNGIKNKTYFNNLSFKASNNCNGLLNEVKF